MSETRTASQHADDAEAAAARGDWIAAEKAADAAHDAAPGSPEAKRADQAAEGGRAPTWREALNDPRA